MICELYRRRGVLGAVRRGWSFRLIFANGKRPNDVYRSARDARRGAEDLITAIRSEGDGIEFRIIDKEP